MKKKFRFLFLVIILVAFTSFGQISVYAAQTHQTMQTGAVKVKQVKGQWQEKEGNWYYKTKSGYATGLNKIDADTYYFNKSGVMQKGWKKIKNKWYFFQSNGAMKKGWLNKKKGWFYLDVKSGEMKTGLTGIKGKKYLFDANGIMQTGWKKHKGKWYYFNSNGIMQTGWLVYKGKKYYMNKDGTMKIGALNLNGTKYFMNNNGVMKTGWKKIKDKWYYYQSDGTMAKKWKKIKGKWYYLDKKTGVMKTGWLKVNGKTYYLGDKNSGAMVTGTQNINGKIYSFDASGALISTGGASTSKADALAKQRLKSEGNNLKGAYSWAVGIPYSSQPQGNDPDNYALWSFENGKGDCIGKAAVFWKMAKALGYEAKLMYGYVPQNGGGSVDHSWVEINYNGSWYVCDPDFEYETGRNGYFIYYGQSGTWMYQNYYAFGK